MREITIRSNEAGQRLDKFLHKYMKDAPSSLFYKMMRKKNILLNGKKCAGQEILTEGDLVKLFFAEDTFEKFGAPPIAFQTEKKQDTADTHNSLIREVKKAFLTIGSLPVIYEDEHILAVNKPAELLTQKALPQDMSLNEWLIGYLLDKKNISEEELYTFHPSVCNRLDRNTSGLVLCAKSLPGAQFLTEILRLRSVHKYYRLFVLNWPQETILNGFLIKDETTNKVSVTDQQTSFHAKDKKNASVRTGIKPLQFYFLPSGQKIAYVQAELFTGRTHQIRAHLASAGYPLLGDEKYGNSSVNKLLKPLTIRHQLLHAYQIVFPDAIEGNFSYLSKKVLTAEEPDTFHRLKNYVKKTD